MPFLSGARCSDWWGEDEEGSVRQQLRSERRRAEEDGGRGQSGWTDTFLCKTTAMHLSNHTGAGSKTQTGIHYGVLYCKSILMTRQQFLMKMLWQYETPSSSHY